MNSVLYMVLAFLAGLVLGTLFFGGLWLTINKALTSKIPALWFSASFFLRMGVVVLGFYYISLGNWQRLIICLFGFVVARFVVTQLTKPGAEKLLVQKKEAGNET